MTEENISNLLMMMSEAGSNVDKFKKSYEKAITERVATECEKLQERCDNVRIEMVKTKRDSQAMEGTSENAEQEFSLNADKISEKVHDVLECFDNQSQMIGQCVDLKAAVQERYTQLSIRLDASKAKLEELTDISSQYPSEALFYKIEEENKNYEEAFEEMSELQDEIAQAKKKRDETREKVIHSRKDRDVMQKRLGQQQKELAGLLVKKVVKKRNGEEEGDEFEDTKDSKALIELE